MYLLSRPRSELILLASVLILVIALIMRLGLVWGLGPTIPETSMVVPKPVELGAESTILTLQNRIRLNPDDTVAYAQLGLALLQRVRETGDPSLYTRAELAFSEALERDPQHLDALIGQGLLALARHQFTEALAWGEQARALNPFRAQVYGIIGDAQVELGQYEAATATIQKMVDTRPDLSSYSRVSYLRELYGDVPGAIEAMERAIAAAGTFSTESALWTQVQLGHLYFNSGNLQQAEATYTQALRFRPDYIYAFAGIARVRAAQGKYQEAIGYYRQVIERLPLPEFVIALGELYEVTGQAEEATLQYDLVRVMQQLNASAGVDVDLELALFEVDHGADPVRALQQARAAYARRPSIYAADTLAWALYHNGQYDQARAYSLEALRLGSRDAMLHYHAGMIAYALSEMPSGTPEGISEVQNLAAARAHLQEALSINPAFSVRYAPQAQALLAGMGTD